ncbi:MAG TPA: type II toxin-antitoxin system VapC family toxin [Actinomycetota bacterium]|nr:type II toxin-antitoxin system VapC family toxin [Actinomycetota bacterium]
MRELLLDTSVLLNWFHRTGEGEIELAEWHLEAHRQGLVHAHILDLGVYELGNVLVRALGRTAQQASAVLNAALALCGPPLSLPGSSLSEVAQIACDDGLTFYDAAFAVAAREHGCALVSADRKLLSTGHAITLEHSKQQLRGTK